MRKILCVAIAALAVMFASEKALAADRVIYRLGEQLPPQVLNQDDRNRRLEIGTILMNQGMAGVWSNLAILPSTGLQVTIGPAIGNTYGAVYQVTADDTTPYGDATTALPADATQMVVDGLMKAQSAPLGPFTAPTASGQQIAYLIEAQLTPSNDNTLQSMVFLDNLGNPTTSNVDELRSDDITFLIKGSAPGVNPANPTPDTNYIAIGYVRVNAGQTSISSANITMATATQFVGFAPLGTVSPNTCAFFDANAHLSSGGCNTAYGTPTTVTAGSSNVSVTQPSSANYTIDVSRNPVFTTVQSAGNIVIQSAGTATSSANYGSAGGVQLLNSFWNGSAPVTNTWSVQTGSTGGNLDFYFDGTRQAYLTPTGVLNLNSVLTSTAGYSAANGVSFVSDSSGNAYMNAASSAYLSLTHTSGVLTSHGTAPSFVAGSSTYGATNATISGTYQTSGAIAVNDTAAVGSHTTAVEWNNDNANAQTLIGSNSAGAGSSGIIANSMYVFEGGSGGNGYLAAIDHAGDLGIRGAGAFGGLIAASPNTTVIGSAGGNSAIRTGTGSLVFQDATGANNWAIVSSGSVTCSQSGCDFVTTGNGGFEIGGGAQSITDDGSGTHGINISTNASSTLGVRYFFGSASNATEGATINPDGSVSATSAGVGGARGHLAPVYTTSGGDPGHTAHSVGPIALTWMTSASSCATNTVCATTGTMTTTLSSASGFNLNTSTTCHGSFIANGVYGVVIMPVVSSGTSVTWYPYNVGASIPASTTLSAVGWCSGT